MAAKDESKSKGTSKNVEKIVNEVSKLTVLELSDLVLALQEKLGVTGVPVAAAPAAAPSAVAETGESQAQGEAGAANQTVIMTGAGDNKIAVIKAIREINQNLGLKDAKDMTENLPAEILKDAKAEDVKSAVEKLKAAGATVELK